MWLLSWVAAIDPSGREGYASGLRMLLPPALAHGLRAGDELGTLIDRLFAAQIGQTTNFYRCGGAFSERLHDLIEA